MTPHAIKSRQPTVVTRMNLILDTPRLRLRPLALEDLDIALALLTDADVMRFVGGPQDPRVVEENLPRAVRRSGGGCIGMWCVSDRVTGEKYGDAVLTPLPVDRQDIDWSLLGLPDVPPGEIEVGYLLKPTAWGRGFATEIAARLLRFAFESTALDEVVAVTDIRNLASQRVLLKCGMTPVGRRRAYAEEVEGFRMAREQWLRLGAAGRLPDADGSPPAI